MADNVNSPRHYTAGGIETIDYIRAKLSPEQFRGYCLGNVLKYVSRADLKGGAEDLKKAQTYLRWAVDSAAPAKLTEAASEFIAKINSGELALRGATPAQDVMEASRAYTGIVASVPRSSAYADVNNFLLRD